MEAAGIRITFHLCFLCTGFVLLLTKRWEMLWQVQPPEDSLAFSWFKTQIFGEETNWLSGPYLHLVGRGATVGVWGPRVAEPPLEEGC